MVTEIINQQEYEDGYPTVYTLQELEPAPDAIDPFSGRKMWFFEECTMEVWAFKYKDAVDIVQYIKDSQSFSL